MDRFLYLMIAITLTLLILLAVLLFCQYEAAGCHFFPFNLGAVTTS